MEKIPKILFFFFSSVLWEEDSLTTNCCRDTSEVNETRKVRTDRSEHTQGRSEGEQRCGKFPGKVGNDISISIRSDLEVGGVGPAI